MLLIYVCTSHSEWIISDTPPVGFADTQSGMNVTIYFQGVPIGHAYVITKNGNMTLSQLTPLDLKKYGLIPKYIAQVINSLSTPDTPANEHVLCKNPKSLTLTYKDICQPIATKTIFLVLNPNNEHLYIIVNPHWIDTRLSNSRQVLPDSTSGFSYYMGNHLDYSIFKSNKSDVNKVLNLNQNYGISVGNTSFHGSIYANWQNKYSSQWGLNQFYGVTHQQGRYYQGGMINFPPVSNIIQQNMLGFLVGSDRQTVNIDASQGTPVILSISSPSKVIIRNKKTTQILYVATLFPGIQQINTSRFIPGIYPISISVTDTSGKTTKTNRLYIKNTAIPLLGHPTYDIGIGYPLSQKAEKLGFFNVSGYDFSHLSLFASTNIATGYRGAITLGAFTLKKSAVASVMETLYGRHYLITASTAVSSKRSFGIGGTLTVPMNENASFYTQLFKTWEGNDHYFSNQYQLNSSAQFSWEWKSILLSSSAGIVLTQENKPLPAYSVNISRNWSYQIDSQSYATLHLSVGKNSEQGTFAMLTFSINYLNGLNQLQLQIATSTDNLTTGHSGFTLTPLVFGKTGYTNADKQLLLSSNLAADHGLQTNTSLNYNSNAFSSVNSVSTTPASKSMTSSFDVGVAGNSHMISMASFNQHNDFSGVVIRVNASTTVNYHIMINGVDYGEGVTNHNNFITLPAFQTYTISVVPMSVSYTLPEKNYTTTLYPGNIDSIKINLTRKVIVVTDLLDTKRNPVKGATFINRLGEFASTDDQGYIQFSALSDQKSVTFNLKENRKCKVTLPDFGTQVFYYSKQMICEPIHSSDL